MATTDENNQHIVPKVDHPASDYFRCLDNCLFSKYLPIYILIILVAGIYAQTYRFDYVNYDDPLYILNNPHVRSGLTSSSIKWAFTSVEYGGYWQPLVWLSYMSEISLFGLNPGPSHILNVFLHFLNSLILYYLFDLISRKRWQSLFVAVVFAIHPLHVESVAWITERKDVLCTLFLFSALYAYALYIKTRKKQFFYIVIVLFLLGLMSKAMIMTFPLLALLLDIWPLKRAVIEFKIRGFKQIAVLIQEKAVFILLSIASFFVTFISTSKVGAVVPTAHLSVLDRINNAIVSYIQYIQLTFWPAGLACLYPYSEKKSAVAAVFCLSLLILITVCCFAFLKQHPYLLIGWLWFLISLIPVIGLVQVGYQTMADRFMYVPQVGLLIMITWGISHIVAPFSIRKKSIHFIIASTAVVIVFTLTWLAYRQTQYWKSTESLFLHAVQVTSNNPVAHLNLGREYAITNRFEQALYHYTQAAKIWPKYPGIFDSIGLVYSKLNRENDAINAYAIQIRMDNRWIDKYTQFGSLMMDKKAFKDATLFYKAIILVYPDNKNSLLNLSIAMQYLNRQSEAQTYFSRAKSLASTQTETEAAGMSR